MHNRKLLTRLSDEFADWIVIVAFYSALRAVDSLFAHDETPAANSHQERDGILRRNTRYRRIWESYRELRDGAHGVRYECGDATWIAADLAKDRFVNHHLRSVEKSVLSLRDLPDDLPQITWSNS